MQNRNPRKTSTMPSVAIIGTPWLLTLLSTIINQHHLRIDWHTQTATSFFFKELPLSVDALCCHGQSAYNLPLRKLSTKKTWFFSAPPFSIIPSLTNIQSVFPDVRFSPLSSMYALEEGLWQDALPNFHSHSEPPFVHLDPLTERLMLYSTPYDALIWISSIPQIAGIKDIFAKKSFVYAHKSKDFSISLSQKPLTSPSCLQLGYWAEEGWQEDWNAPSVKAQWTIATPFCIEKFLNKKNIFESFLKKLSVCTRQPDIRVR